jgi:hypothetical protein
LFVIKLKSTNMKKLYTLTLLFLGMVASFAQTFYSENMGTPTATTPIATNAFQNGAPIVYSGTADVRATLPSTGTYTGASGGGNVFFTSTVGRFFLIEGIDTSDWQTANIELTFGQHQGTASDTPSANLTVEVSTDGTNFTALPYTRTLNTGWELITITGGIPSTENLRIRFTQNSTIQYRIDDVKLSNVSAACTLELSQYTTACDMSTLGTNDTYTITLPYTGAGNGTYNITATSGTIGGDNPNTVATGNIVISGVTENTDVTITIIGADCNETVDVIGVTCEPINTLPYTESFDYAAGINIGDTQKWMAANSGDAVVVIEDNLEYTGITSAGNAVSFSGVGSEAMTPFTLTNSGKIFAGFLFSVTDMTNVTTDGTETAFAILTGETPADYSARLFFKKVGEQFQLGLDAAATTTNYTTTAYDVDDVVYVIMGYDYDTNMLKAWINPTIATLTEASPATLSVTLTEDPEDNFAGFLLRQDAAATTPTITFDELRIATNFAAFTLSAPSFDNIAGLKMYPNPLSGNVLNITTDANATKAVAVYDVLGKQVINTITSNGTVNVSGLTSGIYIVKITEEGQTATRKLVVK